MVELRQARQAAARTGIGMQYILKEARVFDIWNRICPVILSEEVSSQATAICKGGTPLSKIFLGDVQRFSEDIDLDIFFEDEKSKNEKIEFIKDNIISTVGGSYEIPDEARRKDVVHFTCKFTNEIGMPDNVFLEFNVGEKMVGDREVAVASSTILPLTVEKVPVYSFHTLIAKKLKAFYERDEGKDVYDIYSSLKITDDVKAIIDILKQVLKAEGIDYGDFSEKVPQKLQDSEKMRSLHGSTNPYIPRNLRVKWDVAAKEIFDKITPYL